MFKKKVSVSGGKLSTVVGFREGVEAMGIWMESKGKNGERKGREMVLNMHICNPITATACGVTIITLVMINCCASVWYTNFIQVYSVTE